MNGTLANSGEQRQFARFVAFGAIAAGVNLVSRYLLSGYMSYALAVAAAAGVAMLTAFTLFRTFVFGASGRPLSEEVSWFVAINLAALAQVWVISVGLEGLVFPSIGFMWHPEEVAHFIGVATPVVTSYLGHRFLTFRRIE